MRVALFGGAFDPPTYGHVLVITALLNSNKVDRVWLVPSGDRVDKSFEASSEARFQMLELAVQSEYPLDDCGTKRVEVINWQVSGLLSTSYTIDLMDYACSIYPQNKFFFVIGSDNLLQLHTWKKYKELEQKYDFLILPRRGFTLPDDMPVNFHLVEMDDTLVSAISSSVARKLLKDHQCLSGVIPRVVAKYIAEKNLYGSSNYSAL